MKRRRTHERGQAAVEFSAMFLVFLLITAGFIDLGRAVWHYNSLSSAAHVGSRYAMVHGSTSGTPVGPGSCGSTLEGLVRSAVQGVAPATVAVACAWQDSSNAAGKDVTVTAVLAFSPTMAAFLPAATINMSATSRMRIMY